MKKILILFSVIFILINVELYSQKIEIIEVDSITNQPDKEIPFDAPFILKIRQSIKPGFVTLVELKRNKTLVQSLASKNYNPGKKFIDIPESFYWVDQRYLYVKFDYFSYETDPCEKQNNILKPSKNYSVLVSDYSNESFDIYNNLYLFRRKGNDSTYYYKALKSYEILNDLQQNKYGYTFLRSPAEFYDSIFSSNFIPKYYNRFYKTDSLQGSINSNNPDLQKYNFNRFKPFLEKAALFLLDVSSTQNTGLSINKSKSINFCNRLYNLSDSCLKKVLKGDVSLAQNNCTAATMSNQVRSDNLIQSVSEIENFEISLQKLQLIGLIDSVDFIGFLAGFKEEINKNRADIEILLSEEEKLKESLLKEEISVHANKIGISTYIYDFDKRNKFQITPDFGWIYYGFQNDLQGLSPYLGFHINFRYINKDIPFGKLPNRTILHYLSFMTAWSLASIAEENERKDFFTSSTLLTGIGIRLNNSLRITGGASWYYNIDPDPEVTKKKIAVAPFVGLSIDLDVKKYLNDFQDLMPQK